MPALARPSVGFIGIGLMGYGMARNILGAGYDLTFQAHRNRKPADDLLAAGAAEADTARAVAERSDIVHLCLPGSSEVESIIRGPDGIVASGRRGLIVVDCSTSDPVSTRALAAELDAAGMAMADAPLSRTPKEALEGTLDTMVGASPETFSIIEPVLQTWAKVIVHLGPVGTGHTMKLVNNFIAMGYAALYSEALAIARRNGLAPQQVDAVIGAGRLRNGFYDTFMRWTLARDPDAHRFTIRNAHKDMRYLASLVSASGSVAPISAHLRNLFAAMEASGEADRFVPMTADFVARQNGLQPIPNNPEDS